MTLKLRDVLRKAVNDKGDEVDLPSIFREMGIINKIDGEQLFKRAVSEILSFRKKDHAREWAGVMKANNYIILDIPAMSKYWADTAFETTADARLLKFYQQELERLRNSVKRPATDESPNQNPHKQQCTEGPQPPSTLQSQFIDRFKNMDYAKMWTLSSGKVVEKALFEYAILLDSESLCHSFILDMTDDNLLNENVFTPSEWNELSSENQKPKPKLPNDLKNYMNNLDVDSFGLLRSKLYEHHDWQVNYNHSTHADFDWVHSTMLNMVRELQSGNLNHSHLESWYNAHIWKFIDTVFDDYEDLTVVRGESTSKASTIRKNDGRQDATVRQKMGPRLDLVIRTKLAEHSKNIELGGGECGKSHEASTGTKRLSEAKSKLPRTLKDMINDILSVYPDMKDDIETFGIITYGLSIGVMRMDIPCGYVCRLVTGNELCTIDTNEKSFTHSFLPCLYLSWVVKRRTTEMVNMMKNHDSRVAKSGSASDWIEETVDFNPQNKTPIIFL